MDYETLRGVALSLSEMMTRDHPCQKGRALCCNDTTVPVTSYDQRVIEDAVRAGTIPVETINQAKENAADQTRTVCPFLGSNNECTIFEARPLACITTGTGGLPTGDTSELGRRISRYYNEGVDEEYPVAKTVSSMCNPCHREMQGSRFMIPGMVVTLKAQEFNYLHGSKSISKMARMIVA